ncbi:hypothetical protein ElyMa_000450700 [Elysia marginata]|uniref:Peptidase S1 domain-containing protein n=1 Tax=Elysia marginata TaxID=1093978 RepID=A0AAV4FPB0_9GAST|nr:hypothetical protein ElyMa_000450700 [Elysia marginata]
MFKLFIKIQRGGVVSASDSRSGGRGFDSRPCHVAVALTKQFTLIFPSPPTCKTGTQLQASNVLVCWGISSAAQRVMEEVCTEGNDSDGKGMGSAWKTCPD